MMSIQQVLKPSLFGIVTIAIVRARRLVEKLAQPWFVQLLLRIALAVPFWRSGMALLQKLGRFQVD
ncbi:hypothetical protein PWR66_17480 [Paraburkholderia sp. A1RO-5]|uniref:hypothetical protein n=1 Tax=Paraburkholderia sp. A1RO-5 TaxID=3028369 RepID=UPI003B7A4756